MLAVKRDNDRRWRVLHNYQRVGTITKVVDWYRVSMCNGRVVFTDTWEQGVDLFFEYNWSSYIGPRVDNVSYIKYEKQEGFEVDRAIQSFNQDLPSNDFQEGYLQSLLYMKETCDA